MTGLLDASASQAKTLCEPNSVEQSGHFDRLPLQEDLSSRLLPGRWSVGCGDCPVAEEKNGKWFLLVLYPDKWGGGLTLDESVLSHSWAEASVRGTVKDLRSSAGAVSRPAGTKWEA